MIPEKKGLYHGNDDYRYNLDRLADLNLPLGLAEAVCLQAERVACLILQNYLTRKQGGWGLTEDVPTLAMKQERKLKGTFGENEAFRNEFAPGHGTAFLVTRQLAFTAAHCICDEESGEENPRLVNATRLVFGFHGAKEKRSDYLFSEDQVHTFKVVAYQHFRARGRKAFYSEWTDWALLKLDREVPWEPLTLNFEKIRNKIELYMLGHPSGLPLKFTYNGTLEGNTEDDFFECKIDAFQGNSGSPTFNALTRKVEGILIEGRKDYEVLDDKETGKKIIQTMSITRSKIISKMIGSRMENCQRLSSLRHLVDKDLLDLKDHEVVLNAQTLIIHSIKELYKSRNTIPRLLEQPLPIDTIYTELVLLCETKENEKEKNTFEEHRINSWEDIRSSKEPIELSSLFETRNDKTPKKLLILGRAGIGKSTLCQYIANQWAEGKLWQEKFEAVFWISLRKLQNVHSAETAASATFRLCCPVKDLFTKDIAQYLEKNREKTLFVLDGLDEINLAKDSQQKKILDQFLQFPYWIITSRPHVAGGIHADDTIENVGYASKTIDLYIQKSFPNDALTIIPKLQQNPILFGFCHIPINLELICTILKKSKGDLSKLNSMTSLYEELTIALQKRFLEKIGKPYVLDWTPKKFAQNEDKEIEKDLAVFELLEAIAWTGMQDRQLIFSLNSERMERIVEKYSDVNLDHLCISGFLQTSQDSENVLENDYSFPHLTFQEFFAARYLVRLLQNKPKEATKYIQEVKFDARFKVVMWFTAGLLRNEEGTWQNLNAFFDCLSKPKDLIGLYVAALKVRCLEECGWQKEIQEIKAYEKEIQNWICTEDQSTQIFKQHYWIDPITKYRLDTFEISPQGAKLLLIPKLISSDRKSLALIALEQVGMADHQTVIPFLLQALNDKRKGWENLRALAALALEKVGVMDPETTLSALRQAYEDEMSWTSAIRNRHAFADIAKGIIKKFASYNTSRAVAEVLKQANQTDSQTLIRAILQIVKDNHSLPQAAIDALGHVAINDPQIAILELLQALKDEDYLSREAAIKALKVLDLNNSKLVTSSLLQSVIDEKGNSSETIVRALGGIGQAAPQMVIPALLQTLKDKWTNVRSAAAEALGKIGKAEPLTVISALIHALKDEDEWVRTAAAKALGKIGQADPLLVIPELLQALKDKNDYETVSEAIEQVCKADPRIAIPELLEALKDENYYVKVVASKILEQIAHTDPQTVIPALLQTLNDKDQSIIESATCTLGQIGQADPQTVTLALFQVLKARKIEQFSKALEKISIADPQFVVSMLLQALKDGNYWVREAAAETLGRIDIVDIQTVSHELFRAFQHQDNKDYEAKARAAAAQALGQLGHNTLTVIPTLISAMWLTIKNEHHCYYLQCAGINAIIKIGQLNSRTTILPLLSILKYARFSVRTVIEALSKSDLAPYLKLHSSILNAEYIQPKPPPPPLLSSTPLSSLITSYKQDSSQVSLYSAAIVKKCMEENLPFFQEENSFCFYEQGKLCKISVPNANFFRIQIEKKVSEYPKFDLSPASEPIELTSEKTPKSAPSQQQTITEREPSIPTETIPEEQPKASTTQKEEKCTIQ